MAANNEPSVFWDKFIPFFYSIGAAVVIIGAMGKIMHYDWAGIMLPIGLGTEALIFLIYALQAYLRPTTEYAWEKVYPELDNGYKGPKRTIPEAGAGMGLTAKMDDMLNSSNMSSDVISGLKNSFQNLTNTVNNLSDIANTSNASVEFAGKMKEASSKMGDLNSSMGTAISSLTQMSDVSKDAADYRGQFQKISQNMSALNAVYEAELNETQRYLKNMNGIYGKMSAQMSDMSAASDSAQQFKGEMAKLTSNLSSLNNVYGSMLSAMKGN
jgi:gliding motility-associated protein GldL